MSTYVTSNNKHIIITLSHYKSAYTQHFFKFFFYTKILIFITFSYQKYIFIVILFSNLYNIIVWWVFVLLSIFRYID
jgi:hypothetical protein